MNGLTVGAEALIKAEIVTRCQTGPHYVATLLKLAKNPLAVLSLEQRAATQDRFDELRLLKALSPTIWMYTDNLPTDLFNEVFKVMPPEHLKRLGLSPRNYLLFRLTWLWLQGRCEGRLENREEYMSRVVLRGTKQYRVEEGKLIAETVMEDIVPIEPLSQAIGAMYDKGLHGKSLLAQLVGGVQLVFRRASDTRSPEERARETLDSIILP